MEDDAEGIFESELDVSSLGLKDLLGDEVVFHLDEVLLEAGFEVVDFAIGSAFWVFVEELVVGTVVGVVGAGEEVEVVVWFGLALE